MTMTPTNWNWKTVAYNYRHSYPHNLCFRSATQDQRCTACVAYDEAEHAELAFLGPFSCPKQP